MDDAISAAKNVINSNEYELWDHRAELGDWSYKYFFTLSKIKSNPAGLTKADNKETILAQRYDEDLRESPRYEHSGTLCPTKSWQICIWTKTDYLSPIRILYSKVIRK